MMRFEKTDDCYNIVYHTYLGDRKLRDSYHVCSPDTLGECAEHTVTYLKREEDFYAVFAQDGHLIGFVIYDTKTSAVTDLGMRKDSRGVFGLRAFVENFLKFMALNELAIRLDSINIRDIDGLSLFANVVKRGSVYSEFIISTKQ